MVNFIRSAVARYMEDMGLAFRAVWLLICFITATAIYAAAAVLATGIVLCLVGGN